MERKREDRSLLTYVLLSLVTCGIYDLIFRWKLINDLNDVSSAKDPDGWKSPNLIVLILLTLVTCGIYSWYWIYQVGNTICRTGENYGERIDENGTTLLLWSLFGSLLCGAGIFVTYHLMLKNMNTICRRYNEEFIDNAAYAQDSYGDSYGYDAGGYGNSGSSAQSASSQKRISAAAQQESEETTQMGGWTIGMSHGAIVCTKGSMQGAEINILDGEMVTIGRDGAASNLVLSDRDISRRHCTVQFNAAENCYYVTDYSSLGTRMNGTVQLDREVPTRCSRGTRIILGQGNNEFILQ